MLPGLLQMQADILQVPVRRPAHLETTSLGAALAAGIGVGFWTAEEAFADLKHNTGRFLAVASANQAVLLLYHWEKLPSTLCRVICGLL